MIDGILQALHDVDGVQATLVLDGDAQILAHRAHAVFAVEMLRDVGRAIINAVDSVQLVHQDWENLTASFLDGKILVRNLVQPKPAPGRASVLAVVADSRLNPSFAGVAIRVAATRLRKAFDDAAPIGSMGVPPPPVRRPDAVLLTPPPITAVAPPLASPSLSPIVLPPNSATPAPAVADAQSAAFLAGCGKALAASVGPMAKVFVKEAVRRLCGDGPFTRELAGHLLVELERHIEDAADRTQFRKATISL